MKCSYRNLLVIRDLHTCNTLFREAPSNLKGKKHSSQLWLMRQFQDPYVEMAKKENYRCRSAYKLLEINERFKILHPGHIVIDCGAAPGSWTQVAIKTTNATAKTDDAVGTVFAIDKQSIYPIEGATLLGGMDFTTVETQSKLLKLLKGNKVNVVLSDMAPNASGVKDIDHENIIQLIYSAFKFALQVSQVDGTFLCKVWDGGKCQQLEKDLSRFYKTVKNVRPQATRDESTEKFLLARGFKGIKSTSSSTT
ncbi:Putative ribosomal RNA methyltransferase CG11447 [Habropoda laboriosa]|uniref:rRNA methyltransferase 2, mitochondrial n=1 Tax=Habropoda laboriosa TaxID=597456 RepID=A0A0L7QV70_9HYME|nr:PREDICTED: rRNA methyltransferase 2, mitochondrial [Habropoda laboriosa]KOC62341.1 Putative ribosomal RNA methyltransferase CG11447 [Habropoda laboriosa]